MGVKLCIIFDTANLTASHSIIKLIENKLKYLIDDLSKYCCLFNVQKSKIEDS